MRFVTSLLLCLCLFVQAGARVNLPSYGVAMAAGDSVKWTGSGVRFADSAVSAQAYTGVLKVVEDFEVPHDAGWQTADFYLLLVMIILLGAIRYVDVKYFASLWKALANTTMGNSQIRDLLDSSGLQNLLMNLFFTCSAGAYLFYIIRFYRPGNSVLIPSSALIAFLIISIAVLYAVKYVAVKFSGWAFNVESITEQYLFNVFLINKVFAVLLLPFILLLGFGAKAWGQPVIMVSFIMGGILLLARYVRSWQVFGSFLQFSKFHFFLYLCASEILPVSVLIKLLLRGFSLY